VTLILEECILTERGSSVCFRKSLALRSGIRLSAGENGMFPLSPE